MVRKGNQHKNSLERKTANRKQTVLDSVDVSSSEQKEKSKVNSQNTGDRELPSCGNSSKLSSASGERLNGTGSKRNEQQFYHNVPSTEKFDVGTRCSAEMEEPLSDVQNIAHGDILLDATEPRGNNGMMFGRNHNLNLNMLEGFFVEAMAHYIRSSAAMAGQKLRVLALDVFSAAKEWLEQQKPRLSALKTYMRNGHDYVLVQIKHVYPIIWTWILHLGQLIFLLSVVWLDCNVRGLCSLLRLGTTSFFTVAWCSILSVIAMVGLMKALIITVISAVVAAFIGLALGILILAIFAAISLWMYGSFWTTLLIVVIGGSSFALSHERMALLVATTYSMYCAKNHVGWLGLFLGLNLSFLSTDVLTYFLRRNVDEQGSHYSTEQDRQTSSGSGHFNGGPSHSSPADDASSSRSAGIPSTSGCETDLTSEGEVLRLLNCNDHYSALGFARFENIDVSLLKREYRKKAMLVHPDKNMGNEKAAEAFKKLQNAYEVLLDTLKRKTYDDELRREELLNYFRRFQSASQKNGKHNNFSPGFSHFEVDDEGNLEESRRIACKKCGDFHRWTRTERSKSQARWCQDCNDFHQAKDGDGWLEQSLHPFLFGLLHKVDAPCAYVCAEGRIYDATEWFICQGMRCPANTHKPSFHVNTTLSSKHNASAKGASSSQRGGGPNPTPKPDETMTEEELFEWLQNAMQSGVFETNGGSTSESPSAKSGGSSKGSSGVKKKRKGKKQW